MTRGPNGQDVRELLPLYAVGELSADEAAAVERALETDPSLAREVDVERALETDPSLARELDQYLELVAVAPPADIKARLLASAGAGRFETFAERLSTLFDVSVDRARELLGLIERAASWEHPVPGVSLIHFEGGAGLCGRGLRFRTHCTRL